MSKTIVITPESAEVFIRSALKTRPTLHMLTGLGYQKFNLPLHVNEAVRENFLTILYSTLRRMQKAGEVKTITKKGELSRWVLREQVSES